MTTPRCILFLPVPSVLAKNRFLHQIIIIEDVTSSFQTSDHKSVFGRIMKNNEKKNMAIVEQHAEVWATGHPPPKMIKAFVLYLVKQFNFCEKMEFLTDLLCQTTTLEFK